MECKICGGFTRQQFTRKILNKYQVDYYYCSHCHFLQTEEPFWLEEAYTNPINISDTGLVQRNIFLSKKISLILFFLFRSRGKYLDYAGGYGLFTRLMRDIGFDFYWHDPFSPNLMARGFEYNGKAEIEAVTIIESFEHFLNPFDVLEKIINISPNIIFTTELLPKDVEYAKDWWYLGSEHGQHLSFYSARTLKLIALKFGLNFITNGEIHLFSSKKINNTLYCSLLKLEKLFMLKYIKTRLHSHTLGDMHFLLKDLTR